MNNTKDKVKDEKFVLDEVFDKINLIKYIDNTENEMSKNSIESSLNEYNLIHLEDEAYLDLICKLKRYSDLRFDASTKLLLNDNLTQEERDYILNHINSELDPYIKEIKFELDTRRAKNNSDRKAYVKVSDEKKTDRKNAMLCMFGSYVFTLYALPETRKMIIDSGKKLVDGPIKKCIKLL